MMHRTGKDRNGFNALPLKALERSMLVSAMAMTTAVFAGPGWEEVVDVSTISAEAQAEQNAFKALEDMTFRQGLILSPEQIKAMLKNSPDGLAVDERRADQQALLATAPAKFEVVGDAVITPPSGGGMTTTIRAGGSFNNGTDLEAFLNYSVSGTHSAFFGRAADGEVIGALATHQDFVNSGYGVYGATGLVNGYGVYARNWSPAGDTDTTGGGVALFATGSIFGTYTPGGSNHLDNHVAVIENRSTQSNHVLALSIPQDESLTSSDNFITFYHGGPTASDAQGSIEGVSGGGINYNTSSADFAEWIPRQKADEKIEAGDIVGIANGQVSRNVTGADHAQVISTAPAFTGNDPGYDKRDQYALVSMMGQVPVKVVGTVKAGDYIVASGGDDGTGIAIPAEKMTPDDLRLMVGRAWESSEEQGMKLINTAVGLGASDAYAYMRKQDRHIASLEQQLSRKIAEQDQHIASLEQQLSSKTAKLDRLAAQMERLNQKVAYIQSADLLAKASR